MWYYRPLKAYILPYVTIVGVEVSIVKPQTLKEKLYQTGCVR